MTNTLRIARGLAGYPGYVHKVRALVLAASVFLVTLSGLFASAVPDYLHDVSRRLSDVTPAADDSGDTRFWFDVRDQDRLWNGHRISRVYLTAVEPTEAPAPPGVGHFPSPGEVFVSPSLRDLALTDPVIADLLAGYTDVGDVGPAGLTGPREYRAVFGLPPASADRMTPAHAYGGPSDGAPDEGRVLAVLAIFLALLIVAPVVGLVLVASKLGEAERGERGAVLRMLGAPSPLAGSIAAIECALVAVPASVAAASAFMVLSSRALSVPLIQVSAFPDSLRTTWWAGATVVTVTVVLHCAVAAHVTAGGKRTVQPLLAITAPARWPLGLFGVSTLLLIGLGFVTALPPSVAGVAFFVAVGAIAGTLAFALPALLQLGARRIAPRLAGAERYGARIVGVRPLPSVRLAALTGLLVVALGSAVPFLAILKGGPESLDDYSASHPQSVVTAFGIESEPERLESLPGVLSSAHLIAARSSDELGHGAGPVDVLVATCAQARELLDLELENCSPSTGTWLNTDQIPISHPGTVAVADGADVRLPPADVVEVSSSLPVELSEVLLLDPRVAGRLETDREGSGLVFRVETAKVDGLIARITTRAPWAEIRTGDLEFFDPDHDQYPGTTQILLLAGVTSLTLAGLTLIAATLGETAAQRRRVQPMVILGAPPGQLLRLHLVTSAVPIAAAGWLATAMAWLIGRALYAMDDRAATPGPMYLALIGGSFVLALAVFLVGAPVAASSRRDSNG